MKTVDVIVVGAGFAGLYALYALRKLGLNVIAFEAAADVGGTWHFNRYPGARCDVESIEYSYSFSDELQREWKWRDRYAEQAEILAYLQHVCERFRLRPLIHLSSRVESARYCDSTRRWTVRTANGLEATARFCVMATGCLSTPRPPDYEGFECFGGETLHTGAWPEDGVVLTDRRVGVLGTGSSGVQVISTIAPEVRHLTVFQRTACYSLPARNRPLTADEQSDAQSCYPDIRQRARSSATGIAAFPNATVAALEVSAAERDAEYERHWNGGRSTLTRAFVDLLTSVEANRTAAEFVERKIRSIVRDPVIAERLVPRDVMIGTKRVCLDTGYYETFNRPNVSLVDLTQTPITRFTPAGVLCGDREIPLDVLILATGYDAITGTLLKMHIQGRDGLLLSTHWSEGPRAYLGVMSAGFPNLFMVTGPGSPSILANVVVSIEQHVEWIARCIDDLQRSGYTAIEAEEAAETAWTSHVREVAALTLLPRANSWYTGANVPGKPRGFMAYAGGVARYGDKLRQVTEGGYTGFSLTRGTGEQPC